MSGPIRLERTPEMLFLFVTATVVAFVAGALGIGAIAAFVAYNRGLQAGYVRGLLTAVRRARLPYTRLEVG